MKQERSKQRSRRGAMGVLAAILMVVMCIIVAFAVDLGSIALTRNQLQRSTDAAALAGAYELVAESRLKMKDEDRMLPPETEAVIEVVQNFALHNRVGSHQVELSEHPGNTLAGEILLGTLNDPSDLREPISFADPTRFNTVMVRKELTMPSFFSRLMGFDSQNIRATAAATAWTGVKGFHVPTNEVLNMLPITFKNADWVRLRHNGQGYDEFAWDSESRTVTAGADEIHEWNLYPNDTTSGNFGTIDLGAGNNSAADLRRQILHGLSSSDLSYFGGKIELGNDGTLAVEGDTGLSASIKASLEAIIGEQRIIPLYSIVEGNGNNTYYTIVGFAGIRIMHVRLTGAKKALIVQMSNVTSAHAIVDPNLTLPNDLVYSSPRLTR